MEVINGEQGRNCEICKESSKHVYPLGGHQHVFPLGGLQHVSPWEAFSFSSRDHMTKSIATSLDGMLRGVVYHRLSLSILLGCPNSFLVPIYQGKERYQGGERHCKSEVSCSRMQH